MKPQETRRADSELSLGQDPDLIARYLRGEDVSAQLLAMERGELPGADREGTKSPAKTLKIEKPVIQKHEPERREQVPPLALPQQNWSLPAARSHQRGPRWSLVALAMGLGSAFAISIWIFFQ